MRLYNFLKKKIVKSKEERKNYNTYYCEKFITKNLMIYNFSYIKI